MCGKKELPLLMASMICGALCSGGNAETMCFGELLCDNGETLILSAPARWEGKLNGSSIAVEFSENRCRIPCDCKQQNHSVAGKKLYMLFFHQSSSPPSFS